MKRTYVFTNIEKPYRIKMIEAWNNAKAIEKLAERLRKEPNSGEISEYIFSYFL